jgi:hypothetical protein
MTRIKTVRKKGKIKPKEKGKPLPYKKLDKSAAKDIKSIRGIFNGWKKAKKFILRLQSNPQIRMYVDKNGLLTDNRKEAMEFAHGYDNPAIKIEYWTRQLGFKVITENI